MSLPSMPSKTPGEGIPSAAQAQAKRAAAVKAATDAANAHKAHLEQAASGMIHQDSPDAWQPEKANDPLKGSKPPVPQMGVASNNLTESKIGPDWTVPNVPTMGQLESGIDESKIGPSWTTQTAPGMGKF